MEKKVTVSEMFAAATTDEEILQVIRSILQDDSETAWDVFWQRASESLLAAVFYYLKDVVGAKGQQLQVALQMLFLANDSDTLTFAVKRQFAVERHGFANQNSLDLLMNGGEWVPKLNEAEDGVCTITVEKNENSAAAVVNLRKFEHSKCLDAYRVFKLMGSKTQHDIMAFVALAINRAIETGK